jgi:hypothetical protein
MFRALQAWKGLMHSARNDVYTAWHQPRNFGEKSSITLRFLRCFANPFLFQVCFAPKNGEAAGLTTIVVGAKTIRATITAMWSVDVENSSLRFRQARSEQLPSTKGSAFARRVPGRTAGSRPSSYSVAECQ